MTCCQVLRNGRASAPLPPLFRQDDVVARFAFGNQGTIDFNAAAPAFYALASDQGPTVPFLATRQTVFAGSTWGVVPGSGPNTGLRFRPNAQPTVWTSTVATRTAAAIQFNLLDFWNAFDLDGMRNYFFFVYCSTLTLPTAQVSPTGFHFGVLGRVNVPGASSDRYRAIRRHNAAGAQALGTIADAAANGNYTSPLPTADTKAFGFQLGTAMDCYAGEWDTGGGQLEADVRLHRQVASLITTTTGGAQYKDQVNDIVIAMPTGNALADVVLDVESLVVVSPR